MREARSSEVVVEGLRSPLIEAGPKGDSEAVVFVHGNPGSRRDWEGLTERVGEFGRAVAFDMPGFGQADKPDGFDYTVEGYAAFLGGALERLEIERAHLVLHDFGGPPGIAWAAAHPDSFASAVLFNTGSVSQRKWHVMARLWRTPVVGEIVMATTSRAAWRRVLSFSGGRPLPRAFVDRMYDDYDRGTRRAVLRLYRATDLPYPPAPAWAAAIRGQDRPALIVWGAKDPFIGPKGADALRRDLFPSAEIVMLPESGHWPFIDDPERAIGPAIGFLRDHLGARSPA